MRSILRPEGEHPFRAALPRIPLLLALVAASSCGELTPIEPGPDTGPVTAYIDGDPFIAQTVTVRDVQSLVTVTATAGATEVRFEFQSTGPNNYIIGPGNPVEARVTLGTVTWTADATTGSGTITVTDRLPGLLSGSFDFTVIGADDSTVRVTQGRFVIMGF